VEKMKKSNTVIVVGELNVDLILNQIEGYPEIGKEKIADQMTLTLGSSSAIFASNLSSLGADVAFLGMIGSDQFGDLCIKSLQEKNVNTEYIIRSEDLKTGATIILNYDEDRAMITHPGAMDHLKIKHIPFGKLKDARHFHLSSVFLQPGLKPDIVEIFKRAKETGLTTSLDVQWDPREKWDIPLRDLLPFVDVFLPNRQELEFLTGKTDYEQALDAIKDVANIVALKLGNAGSLCMAHGKISRMEAFLNTEVVDAIGAGDSFNAGFISKYIRNSPLDMCQRFGNLTGAISTTAAGGTTAFQNPERIMKIAAERFGYSE
jgi:sugar/nucleoside kinase (ribokinase family)